MSKSLHEELQELIELADDILADDRTNVELFREKLANLLLKLNGNTGEKECTTD